MNKCEKKNIKSWEDAIHVAREYNTKKCLTFGQPFVKLFWIDEGMFQLRIDWQFSKYEIHFDASVQLVDVVR